MRIKGVMVKCLEMGLERTAVTLSNPRPSVFADAPARTAQGCLVFRKMLVFTPKRTRRVRSVHIDSETTYGFFAKRTATQHARPEMTHTLRSLGKCTAHCRSMVRWQASCEHNGNAK
jgi:hypothetical protein